MLYIHVESIITHSFAFLALENVCKSGGKRNVIKSGQILFSHGTKSGVHLSAAVNYSHCPNN